MNMDNSKEHIEESCRICLANYFKGQSIFTPYKKRYLPHIIHILTQIYVTKDDKLPSTICFHCADQLIQAECIKKKCISSDKFLKKQQRKILSDDKLAENIKSDKIISKIKDEQQDNNISSQNFNESRHLHDDVQTNNDTNSNENENSHDPLPELSNQQRVIRVKTVESINENANYVKQLFSLLPELYICVVCSGKYNLRSFRRHQQYHASEKVKCPICWEEIDIESIKKHVFNHKEKNELMCGECGSSYKDLENLFPHVISHDKKIRIRIKNQNFRNYVLQCNLCDNKTTSQISHQAHMQRKHNTTDKYPFKCDICSKRFCTKAGFIQHFIINHNLQRDKRGTFTCAHCEKTFSTKISLQKHMMRLHTGERPYKCDECDQRFSYAAAALLHKLAHTGEKPYLCSICGKAFKQFSALQYHENMHADSRPHACNICKRAFRVKGALTTHMKIHGDKKFRCGICNRAFTMRCLLRKHMKKTHDTLQESTGVEVCSRIN